MDEQLKSVQHMNSKYKVAAASVRNIASIMKYLTLDNAKKVACSMVLSHLDYGNGIFSWLPESTLHKAQRIQNWCAKTVLQRSRYNSSTQALCNLHWLPIRARVNFKILRLVFKALNDQAPSYIKDLLVFRKHSRNTRASVSAAISLTVPMTKWPDAVSVFMDLLSGTRCLQNLKEELKAFLAHFLKNEHIL